MRALRLSFPPVVTVILAILLWYQVGLVQQVSLPSTSDLISSRSVKEHKLENSETVFDLPVPFLPKNGLANLYDRPLFSETRRKPVVVQIAKEPVSPPQPEVAKETPKIVPPLPEPSHVFRGIFGQEGTLSALLFEPEYEVEIWVETGEVVAGWIVQEITPDYVKFKLNEREYIVKLIP